MGTWEGLDRRKFPRAICPCLVTLRKEDDGKDMILTHTENLGIGGICVILKKGLKIFWPVDIEVDLLDFKEHVKCKGKVVWSIQRKSEEVKKPLFYDTGIEFVDLRDEDRQRIERGVQNLLKRGLFASAQ